MHQDFIRTTSLELFKRVNLLQDVNSRQIVCSKELMVIVD